MLACINEFRHLYRKEVDDVLRRIISYGSLPAEEIAETWKKANSADGGAEATGRLLYSKYTRVLDFIRLSRFQIDVEAHGRWIRKIQ